MMGVRDGRELKVTDERTGKRHCIELSAKRVAKQIQEARATPIMMRADCTTRRAPLLCAGRVSDCKIGTATVLRPTPIPTMIRETNLCYLVNHGQIIRSLALYIHLHIAVGRGLNNGTKDNCTMSANDFWIFFWDGKEATDDICNDYRTFTAHLLAENESS